MERTPRVTVNDIFRRYQDSFRVHYAGRLSRSTTRVMDALAACRTVSLGGHAYRCDHCGREHIVYNSCKERHCPTCQNLKTTEWLMRRRLEMLPVQYFHVVWTVPAKLNPLFLQNKRLLYDLLFETTADTIRQLSRDPRHLDVKQTGFLSVLHTWSQTLLDHPHIHSIVLGGGISASGTEWVSCKKDYFINVEALSCRFRNLFLIALKRLYKANKLTLEGRLRELRWANMFRKLIDELFTVPWVVHSEPNYSDPKNIFDYLGRYVRKVAISNDRIIKVDEDRVYFRYKDYADNGKRKVMAVSAHEFIRRFLLHVLPKKFVKIRYYGLLGHRNRNQKLRLCRDLLGVKVSDSAGEKAPSNWRELYEKVTGKRVDRCPYCEKGTLVYLQEIPRLNLPRSP